MPMKIIITGATGFVGRNLAVHLREDGHQVVASGRSSAVGAALAADGIEFRAADLRHAEEVRRIFDAADCVLHCGAKSGPWGSFREHFEANVLGTRNVVSACRHHRIPRIVFVSTPSIYFGRCDRFDVSEDDPLPAKQFNHYSKSKLLAEAEIAAGAEQAFRYISLRPRALHGPFDTIFIPRILKMAEGKRVSLVNGGKAWVNITYIDNFVDAVRCCLRAPEDAWNQAYNIANADPITVREWFCGTAEAFGRAVEPRAVPAQIARAVAVAAELAALLPGAGEPTMTRASVDYLAASMTMSIAKAGRLLGYSPRVENHEGFRLSAQWWQANRR